MEKVKGWEKSWEIREIMNICFINFFKKGQNEKFKFRLLTWWTRII